MQLSHKQKEILVGSLLGDAHLEQNGNNVRLRVEHTANQEHYLMWKYLEFVNFVSSKPRMIERFDKRTKKTYKGWHFSTYSLDVFNVYHRIFYRNKKRIVPENIDKLLNSPLSLAVWFMDDGSKRTDCNALRLSTDSFQFQEQKMLQRCLKNNFGIESKLHKKGKFWNIYIPNREAKNFCAIVKPYIVPVMEYKISLTP